MSMFSYIPTESDFNRKGSLKTLTTFESCANITSITIRQRAKYKINDDLEKVPHETYYLLIEDGYGMQWSYFRENMNLEKSQEIAAKIPYGKTVFIGGEVAVRKGNTFFNATSFRWPDGKDILMERRTEDEKPGDFVFIKGEKNEQVNCDQGDN